MISYILYYILYIIYYYYILYYSFFKYCTVTYFRVVIKFISYIIHYTILYMYINYIDTKTEEEINNKWNYHVCLVRFTYCIRILDIYVHIIS